MGNFKHISPLMQQLVDYVIDNSIDFCADMRHDSMEDDEIEAMTIAELRAQVADNAQEFFRQELDPNGSATECPPFIAAVITERVRGIALGKLVGPARYGVRVAR